MRSIISVALCLTVLSGCGSTGNKNDLQTANTNLKRELAASNQRNSELQANITLLDRKIETLNQVVSVLDTEKTSRIEESSMLRGQVRKFVQNQVDSLKGFLVAGGLLDYVGGELVERSTFEQDPLTVVDLTNRITSAGVLTSVGAYVMQPTSVKVKVLRNIENNLVVVWESRNITMNEVGPNRHEFTNSVGVEKNDIIAYEFTNNVGVGYTIGTGDARYSKQQLGLGSSIRIASLLGAKNKRAYSIGVYGLLNQ